MRRCASSSSTGRHVPTVTEWLTTHIDSLTGVQPATIALPHLRRPRRGSGVRVYAGLGGHLDHDRALGEAAWRQRQDHREQARFPLRGIQCRGERRGDGVQSLSGSASAAYPSRGDGVRSPPEFTLLRDQIDKQQWKSLATWLVTTGMRFRGHRAQRGRQARTRDVHVRPSNGIYLIRI